VRRRPDVTRAAQLEAFVGWLTGPLAQRDLDGGTGRSFRARHAWCWGVEPVIAATGQVHDEIQVDGTYLADGWCLLLAIDGTTGTVIAWQWCDAEKTAAWTALLERIAAPRVVVADGGVGLASALKACWPTTKLQRCLVHVQRNVRTYLTRRPRTPAARALRALSLTLTQITTADQAATWEVSLHEWHQVYGPLINARTYLKDVAVRPADVKAGATWWWTHDRLRKAYRLLERLTRQGVLFTYLDPDPGALPISSTTNRIEGGANHPIKDLLRRHRGMTSAHQRRATEWWCYLHSTDPRPPRELAATAITEPSRTRPATTDEPPDPTGYDTGLTADEGLWIRHGWAGRSR